MNPIVSLEFYNEDYIDKFQGMVAWLLYSDLDTNFAKYVKEAWNALNRLSGRHCLITLIEEPRSDHNVNYWKRIGISDDNSKKIYKSLIGEKPNEHESYINNWFLQFKPYDRNVHIEIADRLGISYIDMPCLVFYTSTKSEEYLVYSFSNDWTFEHLSEHMKAVFTAVRKRTDEMWKLDAPEEVRRQDILYSLESDFRNIRIAKLIRRVANNQSVGNVIKSIGLLA